MPRLRNVLALSLALGCGRHPQPSPSPAPAAPACTVSLGSGHELTLSGAGACPGTLTLELRVATGDPLAPTWAPAGQAPVQLSGGWTAQGAFAERTLSVTNPGAQPVQLVGLEWTAALPGAPDRMLHDGYQSWSYTGLERIPASQPDALGTAPHGGDNEDVLGEKAGVSWWWTALFDADAKGVVAGAESAAVFKTYLAADGARLRIVQGLTGDALTLAPGQTRALDGLFVGLGEVGARLEDYAARVAALHPPAVPRHAALGGWGSWNLFYAQPTSALIDGEMDWAKQTLAPLGLRDFLLDDGYEPRWGEWSAAPAFGADLPGVTGRASAAGLSPALWLAPVYVDATDAKVTGHPDWFVHRADGSLRTFSNAGSGSYAALDVTSPGARDFVTASLQGLRDAGFHTLKIDFLFGAAIEGVRQQPLTGMESYRQWLQLIRQAVPEVHLVGCGAPLLPSVGWVDSMRTGPDIAYSLYPTPQWGFVAVEARHTALRGYTDHWWLLDPDVLLLRGTDIDDAQAWVAAVSWAMAGGTALLGDGQEATPLRQAMALAPELLALTRDGPAARPVDWGVGYDRAVEETPIGDLQGHTVVPQVWARTSADGQRHALAVFGWNGGFSGKQTFPSGAQEVLRPSAPGPLAHQPVSGEVQVEVAAHDARLFLW